MFLCLEQACQCPVSALADARWFQNRRVWSRQDTERERRAPGYPYSFIQSYIYFTMKNLKYIRDLAWNSANLHQLHDSKIATDMKRFETWELALMKVRGGWGAAVSGKHTARIQGERFTISNEFADFILIEMMNRSPLHQPQCLAKRSLIPNSSRNSFKMRSPWLLNAMIAATNWTPKTNANALPYERGDHVCLQARYNTCMDSFPKGLCARFRVLSGNATNPKPEWEVQYLHSFYRY